MHELLYEVAKHYTLSPALYRLWVPGLKTGDLRRPGFYVSGVLGDRRQVSTILKDRIANGQAFTGERLAKVKVQVMLSREELFIRTI